MNVRAWRGFSGASGEEGDSHLAAALFWSLAIHGLFLVALASGRIGPGLVRQSDFSAMPRLEARFSSPPADRHVLAAEAALAPCFDCTKTRPQAAVKEREVADPADVPGSGAALAGYWPMALLDTPPRPLQEIDLNTPELDAVAANGKIELTALVSARGRVDDVQFLSVDTASDTPLLRRLLAERFLGTRFSPGLLKGRAVAASVPITVVIEPQ